MHNEILSNTPELENQSNVFDEFEGNREKSGAAVEMAPDVIDNKEYVLPVMPGGNGENVDTIKGVDLVVKDGDFTATVKDIMASMKNNPARFNDKINEISNEVNDDVQY